MTHIRLAMIVKNGEKKLPVLAPTVKPLIQSWYVLDTGSTDRTREIVVEQFADIPGFIGSDEWESHSKNRTRLLARAREYDSGNGQADYLLMLDDDMELVITEPLPPLVKDEYMIPIHDRSLIYPLPLLTSTRRQWEYRGAAHAYLCAVDDAGPVSTETLTQIHLVEHFAGTREGKIEEDRDNLIADLKEHPDNARSWFYLGQSHRDLGQYHEAIAAYRMAALLSHWDEEKYYALYQAGSLLASTVSFFEGAPVLLEAWRTRPNRAEALRTLGHACHGVADKLPFPVDDKLFVEPSAYKREENEKGEVEAFANVMATDRRKPRVTEKGLDPEDVAAIIVTRGDHPDEVQEIVEGLPYGQVVVWDNSKAKIDLKVFGRYAAIPLTSKPVVFWQDDDVKFWRHEELLAAYEPGKLIANMDRAWIDGAGYGEIVSLVGAGSLCDADIPGRIWTKYFESFPTLDDNLLLNCDFAFGTLVDWTRVDLGYDTYPYTDDADRLYRQPGQTQAKWAMIERCWKMKTGEDLNVGAGKLWIPA